MTTQPTDTLTEDDLRLRDWIISEGESRGNAVIQVPGDAEGTGYAFTAGVWRLHGVAEAVVIGLPEDVAPVLLDAYVDRAATGEPFEVGGVYPDFFEELQLTFERVAKGFYPEFFGSNFLLYPDGAFPAVQIVLSTPEGHWPWSPDAPDGFAEWQPVLTESGVPESWTPGHDGP